jgi:enoyl-CoA hydratase/carnithine racemase
MMSSTAKQQAAPQGEATTPVLSRAGAIATIRLNRPRVMNRIEPADLAALTQMLEEIEADRSIRVLVLTGTGKAFSSGYHLGDLAERTQKGKASDKAAGQDSDTNFERVANMLEDVRVPVICRLNGGVYGGSTDLALACDFRIGHTGCEMFMPAGRLGVHYYKGGIQRYVTRLGVNAAKMLFLTARKIDANEMLAIGYLTELCPPDELDLRVGALADQLAAMAPLSVAGMKRSINEFARQSFDDIAFADRNRACRTSSDLKEGLAAFKEKRKASFTGS